VQSGNAAVRSDHRNLLVRMKLHQHIKLARHTNQEIATAVGSWLGWGCQSPTHPTWEAGVQ
jgi:hypothetical protein